jgi:GNAT superfamily N-acetyltransferase
VETGDLLAPGAADASVRPARTADVAAIGAVQLRSWRREYADLLPGGLLDGLRAEDLAGPWHAAVTAPPSPRHAVLVACAGAAVVGFAAVAPSGDSDATGSDAELVALEVDPAHQRSGHGSRLLAAAADAARDHGFTALRVWVPAADEPRRAFLMSAGPRPDGARRHLRTPTPPEAAPEPPVPVEIVEERLTGALAGR